MIRGKQRRKLGEINREFLRRCLFDCFCWCVVPFLGNSATSQVRASAVKRGIVTSNGRVSIRDSSPPQLIIVRVQRLNNDQTPSSASQSQPTSRRSICKLSTIWGFTAPKFASNRASDGPVSRAVQTLPNGKGDLIHWEKFPADTVVWGDYRREGRRDFTWSPRVSTSRALPKGRFYATLKIAGAGILRIKLWRPCYENVPGFSGSSHKVSPTRVRRRGAAWNWFSSARRRRVYYT